MTTTEQNSCPFPESLKDLEVYRYGHLPMAAAYCRQLQLAETINTLVPSEMQLTPGVAVQAMVLDVLSGRSPLYHVKDFLASQDRELLLGEDIDPERFSDYTLARTLDSLRHMARAGSSPNWGLKRSGFFSWTHPPSALTRHQPVYGANTSAMKTKVAPRSHGVTAKITSLNSSSS